MENEIKIPVTSLDYAILGLIQKIPLSGYQIRKEFENTALGNYSSSPGSIYPALKRLLKLNLVQKLGDNSSKKKKFLITSEGLNILKVWFLKRISKRDITHHMNELLLRFGFMDNILTKEQKLHFLYSLQEQLKSYLEELLEYQNSQAFRENHLQGRLAFQYGLDSYKTSLKWCKKCISTLKSID